MSGGVKAAWGSPQLQGLLSPLTWAPWSVSPVFLFSISLVGNQMQTARKFRFLDGHSWF